MTSILLASRIVVVFIGFHCALPWIHSLIMIIIIVTKRHFHFMSNLSIQLLEINKWFLLGHEMTIEWNWKLFRIRFKCVIYVRNSELDVMNGCNIGLTFDSLFVCVSVCLCVCVCKNIYINNLVFMRWNRVTLNCNECKWNANTYIHICCMLKQFCNICTHLLYPYYFCLVLLLLVKEYFVLINPCHFKRIHIIYLCMCVFQVKTQIKQIKAIKGFLFFSSKW